MPLVCRATRSSLELLFLVCPLLFLAYSSCCSWAAPVAVPVEPPLGPRGIGFLVGVIPVQPLSSKPVSALTPTNTQSHFWHPVGFARLENIRLVNQAVQLEGLVFPSFYPLWL